MRAVGVEAAEAKARKILAVCVHLSLISFWSNDDTDFMARAWDLVRK